MRGKIVADTSEPIRMADAFPQYLAAELNRLRPTAIQEANNVFFDIVWQTALGAPNFPMEYTEHLSSVIAAKGGGAVRVLADKFIWEFDWEKELGDRTILSLGYHQEAALKAGGHHQLGDPWVGSEGDLKNPFPTRYKAWQVVAVNGEWTSQRISKRTGKLGKPYTWLPKYTAEQTYAARTEIWGSWAPEWIILDQGTTFFPSVSPTGVALNANIVVANVLADLTYEAVERAQYRAEELSRTGTMRKLEGQSTEEFRSERPRFQKRAGSRWAPGYIGQ